MGDAIEFSGRIARSDGKLVAAGKFDLAFRLYADQSGPAVLWAEAHDDVAVGLGGGFQVILGQTVALPARLFSTSPRWVAVFVRKGDELVDAGERSPITGLALRLSEELAYVREMLDDAGRAESRRAVPLPGGENIDPESRRRLVKLHRRLRRVEQGEGLLSGIRTRLAAVESRLHRLDDDDHGRVIRLEDEVEDIVGSDGDILDLLERVEALEQGRVAAGVEAPAPVVDARSEARIGVLEERVALLGTENQALRKSLDLLLGRLSKPQVQSDSFPGPVTVQKGGVHVASGGLVVHDIEGRVPGASKREGALLVNSRAGGDVVVGNKDSGGLLATGPVRGGRAVGISRTVAIRVGGAELPPGTVVALDEKKRITSVRPAKTGDSPLGVVVERASVELGDGAVAVAIAGIVRVKVSGAVASGDALGVGDGVAVVGSGRLGRALGAANDNGEVEVLLFAP